MPLSDKSAPRISHPIKRASLHYKQAGNAASSSSACCMQAGQQPARQPARQTHKQRQQARPQALQAGTASKHAKHNKNWKQAQRKSTPGREAERSQRPRCTAIHVPGPSLAEEPRTMHAPGWPVRRSYGLHPHLRQTPTHAPRRHNTLLLHRTGRDCHEGWYTHAMPHARAAYAAHIPHASSPGQR